MPNLPTDEHAETHSRVVGEKLLALGPPDEAFFASLCTLGQLANCGCCHEHQVGAMLHLTTTTTQKEVSELVRSGFLAVMRGAQQKFKIPLADMCDLFTEATRVCYTPEEIDDL